MRNSFIQLFIEMEEQLLEKIDKLLEENKNKEVEKLYYKPHFGPEETDDALDKEALRQFLIKKQTR